MSYPSELMYGLRSIDGVSHASFKIPAQTTNDISPNGQIRFALPSNSIVDLRKCKMVFNVATTGTGNTRLGELISLIQRYQITAGGVPISQGCANAHVLAQALRIVHPHDEGDVVEGHPEIYRERSSVLGYDLSGQSETYSAQNDATMFELSLGTFFDTCEPRMISTDLLPQIEVELFLNSASVVCSSAGARLGDYAGDTALLFTGEGSNDASYTISNYSMIAPCYSVMDGMYEAMLDAVIQRQEYLPVAFREYYAYTDAFTGTFQGSNGSSCLNRLIGVFRKNGANTQGAPVLVQGYKSGLSDNANGVGSELQSSNHSGEKYVSKALNFTAPMDTLPMVSTAAGTGTGTATTFTSGYPKLVWRVNSVSLPNFNVPLPQFYGVTKRAFDVDKTMAKSLVEYLNNRFVIAINLGLPNDSVRVKTGLNMRGSSSTIRLETPDSTNLETTNTPDLLVFMDTTAELRIGAGKQLAVIN
jgi:hypothetical protein